MKRFTNLLLTLLITLNCVAQIPDGYYDNTDGKLSHKLKAALNNIIKGHKEYEYTTDTTDTWDILKVTDRDPANSSNVILIYKGNPVDAAQEYNDGNGWTREHVWAKSHGGFGTSMGPGTDVHNLKPCDNDVNTDRGTKDFDEGGTPHSEATLCNYTSTTWEPRDDVKGDVARIMFYMAVRYEGEGSEPDLELVDKTGTSGSTFGKLSTLLKWHKDDPVDDYERNRNEVIYSYQQNRNPFIDKPEFVDSIWGVDAVSKPILSHNNLTFSETFNLSITCDTVDVKIYYTLDGNVPDSFSTKYIGPIEISETTTIKCIAYKKDLYESEIVEHKFTYESPYVTDLAKEDFESGLGIFRGYSVKGDQKWVKYSYNSNSFAKMSGFDNGNHINEDWLISKAFNLDHSIKEYFSFESAMKSYGTDNEFSVLISEDYDGTGNPNDFTWTDLTSQVSLSGGEYEWVNSGNVDISSYSGYKVYIAFKYSCGNQNGKTWEIDNFLLRGEKNKTNELPKIENITKTPDSPKADETVKITAKVTDVDGLINEVYIRWGESETEITNKIVMVAGTNDSYSCDIPATETAKSIHFKIFAVDDMEGNTTSDVGNYTTTAIITNINFEKESQLVLYPNPCSDFIKINDTDIKTEKVNIYDLNGVLVKSLSANSDLTFDVSSISNGSYVFEIVTEKHVYRKIIQKQ